MPSWKKVIISGSAAELSSLIAPSITGSLQGTASFARTASFVTGSNVFGPFGSNSVISASFAVSASRALTSSFSSTAASASYAATASYSTNAADIVIYVKNTTGTQIDKGKVVRITGATGDNALISTASYESDPVSANTLGITRENIANDAFGYVITEGTLLGIDTDLWTAGQLLFLGAAGSITGSAPLAPLHAVRLGQVLRVQQNNGSMYVRIDNGYELNELHDVDDNTTTGSYGDLLVKSGSVWTNSKQLSGSYGLTGSLTIDSNGANGLVMDTDLASSTNSARIFLKNSGSNLDISLRNNNHSLLIGYSASAGASSGPWIMQISGSGVAIGDNYTVSSGRGAILQLSGSINIEEGFAYKQDGYNILYIARGATGTSYDNIIGGVGAASGAINPDQTTAYGYYALSDSNGTANTAVGYTAGRNNTGSNQTLVGWNAGADATGGSQTAMGRNAGYGNNGTFQVAYGYQAGYQNVGTNQTAIGSGAGYQNTASNQTAIGESAGYRNSGSNQTAVGSNAGDRNTATQQSALGLQAGYLNTGVAQTALGQQAGQSNIGTNQTATGYVAGYQNSGSFQTATGANAGRDNKGDNQTATGYEAGRLNTADNQTVSGYEAGYLNTGSNQTATGYQAGVYNSGSNQVAMGNSAGESNSGNNQTAIGSQAGYQNSGPNQTAVGTNSGYQNTGSDNTNIGYQAGTYTTGVIINSQSAQSVFLGSQTTAGGGNRTNQIVIGFSASGIGSNSVVLGNSSITTTALRGNVGIGTTTPTAKLDVSGSTIISGSLTTTSSVAFKAYTSPTSFTGTAAGYLAFDSSGNILTVGAAAATPGGSTTQLQYNNAGVLAGTSAITFDGTTLRATGSFTGSLVGALTGTASFAVSASRSITSSFAITSSYITASGVFGPFGANSVITSSFAVTASYFNATIQTSGSTIYSTNPAAGPNFNTTSSIFIGSGSGFNASNADTSIFIGSASGYQATNAAASTFIGQQAGYQATNAGNSVFIGIQAGKSAIDANNSVFIGNAVGVQSSGSDQAVFVGYEVKSDQAPNAVFIGSYITAHRAVRSVFIGVNAGHTAHDAFESNFLGRSAGFSATYASGSNFFGTYAGYQATNASTSNFIGPAAGFEATNAASSNFIGTNAGRSSTAASYSIAIGHQAGYNAIGVGGSIGANNIIIGTNITLPVNASDSINIGGIIFGTGSYSDITTNPYAGAVANGRIGIGTTAPNATLDVNGSTIITGSLTVGNGTNTNLDPYGFVFGSGSYLKGSTANSAILGGTFNKIDTEGTCNVILGGTTNTITGSGSPGGHYDSAIIGGSYNTIDSSSPSVGELIAASYSSSIKDGRYLSIIASSNCSIDGVSGYVENVAMIACVSSSIDQEKHAVIIGGEKNTFQSPSNRLRSVILGGSNITGSKSDTVYMPNAHVTGSFESPAGNTINSNALIQAGLLYLSNNF